MSRDLYHLSHMFCVWAQLRCLPVFYLNLTLLYIGIVPDEDLRVEMLLLIISFGAAIFSVQTSLLPSHTNQTYCVLSDGLIHLVH